MTNGLLVILNLNMYQIIKTSPADEIRLIDNTNGSYLTLVNILSRIISNVYEKNMLKDVNSLNRSLLVRNWSSHMRPSRHGNGRGRNGIYILRPHIIFSSIYRVPYHTQQIWEIKSHSCSRQVWVSMFPILILNIFF